MNMTFLPEYMFSQGRDCKDLNFFEKLLKFLLGLARLGICWYITVKLLSSTYFFNNLNSEKLFIANILIIFLFFAE